jgi:glycosyltransferase involved in cell wall biosynthesis
MAATIAILLATYNGAPYLAQQLDSLLVQTNRDWHLLVRDDLSTDETFDILRRYQEQHPTKITIVPNEGEVLGASGNFGALLTLADAPFTMFCDQDDVWLPDKIELTLAAMQRLEALHGKAMPLLVHTDLRVVDSNLLEIAPSLWRYQKTDPSAITLNRLLVQNVATGCTVMINRSLRELAVPMPAEARMHDWWLALVAGAFGRIAHIQTPTILYRQHDCNDSGAAPLNLIVAMRKIFAPSKLLKTNEFVKRLQRQAAAFLQRYGNMLPPRTRTVLEIYSCLQEQGFFKERYYRVKYGFFYASTLMNIRLLLFR